MGSKSLASLFLSLTPTPTAAVGCLSQHQPSVVGYSHCRPSPSIVDYRRRPPFEATCKACVFFFFSRFQLPHFHHCPTGLMGSEKNTLGKILSHILGYSFYDSAALIEQEVDGISVAEIFKCHGESFFRKNEVSQQMPSLYAHMLSFLQCMPFDTILCLVSSNAFTYNSMHQVFYDYGLRSQSGCRSQLLM
ncbi:hypothetical protein V6N13_053922 [Hibiscus sabdariffa]|uniref:Uncharacterized protein n=1 Tax=Hibiscus sabdariffa TaxID=183260 RepID=A0ABR2T735_9ROSI